MSPIPPPGEPIAVIGLWHLGCVTAACLSHAGHHVLGIDPDQTVVERLSGGHPPIFEPGLAEMIGANAERLRFTSEPRALAQARRAWVTFDTPVDADDRADVEQVLSQTVRLLAALPQGALVIVSSQLPVGSVGELEARCRTVRGTGDLRFACIPENLRLGSALLSFQAPERIVAGVRNRRDRQELTELLGMFGAPVQWMRVESAEMTKHALTGFLATSVAFINEVASICERVGADAAEVSRGLKSERRIGPGAYLAPGDAFAGGTLARDISFMRELAVSHGLPERVLAGVADGNAAHRGWTRRKLLELLGREESRGSPLAGRLVAVWALTYKPGTNTLRRSGAIELCRWLLAAGARVRAHDPADIVLPADLAGSIELCADPLTAASNADAIVVCTPWPAYREVSVEDLRDAPAPGLVVDPGGWLRAVLDGHPQIAHVCVGVPLRAPTANPSGPRSAKAHA
jgi:UDPglucose 6-dehydrogenase